MTANIAQGKCKEFEESASPSRKFGTEQVKQLASERSPGKDVPSRKRSAFGDITNAVLVPHFGKMKKSKEQREGKTLASERSPGKGVPSRKRLAFGDITNAVQVPHFGKMKRSKEQREVKTLASERLPGKGVLSRERSPLGDITNFVQVSPTGKAKNSKERRSKTSEKPTGEKTVKDAESVLCNEIPDLERDLLCNEKLEQSPLKEDHKLSSTSDTIPNDVTNIDEDNTDPFMASEYAYEIFQNMKAREAFFPLKSYMGTQKELTKDMRAILVDWLVKAQVRLKLYPETLYLAIKILDHFLMKCPVKREELRLVGAVALFISSKVEETMNKVPLIDKLVDVCCGQYQRLAFVAMERKILATLDFELNIPIPYRFLRRYARAAFANVKTFTLAKFLLESTLLYYQFLEYKPSLLASSCLYLALQMQKCGSWTPTLVVYTGYKLEELKDCVLKLNAMNSEPPKKNLLTVRNKYSHKVFHEVASIPPIIDILSVDFK